MSRLAPWAGWIGGFAAWALSQQGGSAAAQLDCVVADWPVHLAIGLAAAAAALAGGVVSFGFWRGAAGAGETWPRAAPFIALTGALAAALFLLAILFQTLSPFIIPRCFA